MTPNLLTNDTNLQNSFGGGMEWVATFIKSIVRQSMEEFYQDKMYENVVFDQKLTTKQLCDRWKVSDTTLLTWEKKGVISPLKTGGRKKLYSIKDVRNAEVNGYIKNAC